MPGWYIHMESARLSAERLIAGDVPAEYGMDTKEAQRLGSLAHKWRNYLAAGALGPDLFYLLPDFKAPAGGPLLGVADFVFNVWSAVEDHFLGPWDKWMGPVGANDAQLASQLTGGLAEQIAQAVDLAASTIKTALLTVPTRATDIFGRLTSGPPQGFAESAFYWSDMLHYRRTYDVPLVLFRRGRELEAAATNDDERADGEAAQAFALGWASHCATDVVGHAFTNAKSGGPFRLHWQRHHLVENHFDSRAYDSRFGTDSHYRTLGTSALHFRIAWRHREDDPYNGRWDAPAYDYFSGFPGYNLGDSHADETARRQHFSMFSADLPVGLVRLISDTLKEVYADTPPDITPEVLNTAAPAYSDDGRPNEQAMQVMWQAAYRFLAHSSIAGLSLGLPTPPPVITDHSFPSAPGSLAPGDNDRGTDLSNDDVTFLDVLLAIFAWIIFIAQIVVWLITLLPGLVLDVATFPARQILHYAVVAPLYSLYMASRRLLVMTGFLAPDTSEIDPGLVTLGRSSTFWRASLRADIVEASGFAPLPTGSDEPSGRVSSDQAWTAEPAYPRDTPRDPMPVLTQLLSVIGAPPLIPSNGAQDPYSEWVAPWRYPERDVQGKRIGWEADLTHAGPFLLGEEAPILLTNRPTDVQVAGEYEAAYRPDLTSEVSNYRLPQDRHLGYPVDYSLYLISKIANGKRLPSFNLDSDRGYAWQCWDWTRHRPAIDPATNGQLWETLPENTPEFCTQQPCSPPAQFNPFSVHEHQPPFPPILPEHTFDPRQRRLAYYLHAALGDETCGSLVQNDQIPQEVIDGSANGLPPEGEL